MPHASRVNYIPFSIHQSLWTEKITLPSVNTCTITTYLAHNQNMLNSAINIRQKIERIEILPRSKLQTGYRIRIQFQSSARLFSCTEVLLEFTTMHMHYAHRGL